MRRKINQTDPEITQIIERIDKDVKIAAIILHRFRKLESRLSMLNKGTEHMKQTQTGLPAMGSTVSGMKITLDSINRRGGTTEEDINRLEAIAMETTQVRHSKKREEKWTEHHWATELQGTSYICNRSLWKRRGKGARKKNERNKSPEFPRFNEKYKPREPRSSQIPSLRSTMKTTPKHTLFKMFKISDKNLKSTQKKKWHCIQKNKES